MTTTTKLEAAAKKLDAANAALEAANKGESFDAWEKAEIAVSFASRAYYDALCEAEYGIRENESAY